MEGIFFPTRLFNLKQKYKIIFDLHWYIQLVDKWFSHIGGKINCLLGNMNRYFYFSLILPKFGLVGPVKEILSGYSKSWANSQDDYFQCNPLLQSLFIEYILIIFCLYRTVKYYNFPYLIRK
jgi:hypothetical protein